MDGFRRELGVTEDEALDLIGRSVTIAKQAREQYTPRKVCTVLLRENLADIFVKL